MGNVRVRYDMGVLHLVGQGAEPTAQNQPYVRFEGAEGWIQAYFGRGGIQAEPASVFLTLSALAATLILPSFWIIPALNISQSNFI